MIFCRVQEIRLTPPQRFAQARFARRRSSPASLASSASLLRSGSTVSICAASAAGNLRRVDCLDPLHPLPLQAEAPRR